MFTKKRGSISLFLILVLMFLLAFFMVLLESARAAGLKTLMQEAGVSALDSVLASYHTELFEAYGLLFYPGGQSGGAIDFQMIEDEFEGYMEQQMDHSGGFFGDSSFHSGDSIRASVTEIVTASDYNGEVFIRAALDFYKFGAAGEMLETIQNQLGILESGEEAREEHEQIENSRQMGTGAESDTDESREDPRVTQEEIDEAISGSAVGAANQVKAGGYLYIALQGKSISGYTFSKDDFPSEYARDGREPEGDGLLADLTEKTAFNEYLLSYFPSFMDQEERAGVQYELEYLIFGETSDDANFKKTMNRIMWIREGMNLAYIMGDDSKRMACELAAVLLVGWTGVPGLTSVVQLSLEAAWAYAEAVLDARILLSGGKVPLAKTSETWHLSLEGVTDFLRGSGFEASGADTGLKYEDYLRLLLFTTDGNELAYRAMDMIQLNMREKEPGFLMSSQIYAMEIQTEVEKGTLFSSLAFVSRTLSSFQDSYTLSGYFSQVY